MVYLVTGATGNVGRLVVDQLRRSALPVRALTTNPGKAALPAQVEAVTGYLGRPASLAGVFDGVDTMYLAPLPATATTVVEMAKAAGVRRIVALSQYHADDEAAGDESEWHYYAVEKAVQDAGVEWTFLRPGQFFTNALDLADQVRGGVVKGAYGQAGYAAIDLADIAAAAAAAMTQVGHGGKKYPLTGPETLTKVDMVRIIGEVIGRPVRFQEQSRADAYRQLSEGGWGEAANWMLDLDARHVASPQPVHPELEQLVGNSGTRFVDWVSRNASAFR